MTPLADLAWPRPTDRLVLRPATEADLEQVWSYRRLPEVNRWLTAAPPDLAAFTEYLGRPERLAVTLVVSLGDAPDEVVGDLMLRVTDAWAQTELKDQALACHAEVGWALAPSAGGRGYATEAVRELLRICFEDLGLRRVEAMCFAANEPSWRLMERLGMRRESLSRADGLHRSGEWMDGMSYALLADEWQEQHGGR